jgi:dipeptidase E
VRLLLLSNSQNPGREYFEHARAAIRDFLGGPARDIAFVPYAAIRLPAGAYAAKVGEALAPLGCSVRAVDTGDPREILAAAPAVAVGGGNTFQLLRRLQETGLLQAIALRARGGLPYIGWSAGSNVACPTIMTTNDMPVVEVAGFAAMELVPFQINPHYTDAVLPGHQGETRDERLAEYVETNPGRRVVGLREGSILRVEGTRVRLLGDRPARIFLKGRAPWEHPPSEPLDFLLQG